MLAAKLTGQAVDADTARWVGELEPALAGKLARAGLIPQRETKPVTTLGEFLAAYIDGRADVKPASKLVWGHVRRNLVDFFGEQRDVRTITPGDADDYKQWLVGEHLASTTIHKRLQFARTFFRAMLRRKIISEDPFADVKSPAMFKTCGLAVKRNWLGNSPSVAMRHYLITTEEHFEAAVRGDEQAAQKAAQQSHANSAHGPARGNPAHDKTQVLQGFASSCETLQNWGMEDRGLEPLTF